MSELENTVNYLISSFKSNRRYLLLLILLTVTFWLFNKVPEVGSVLIGSYLIALILEPWVNYLETKKISRAGAVLLILLSWVSIILGFMILVMPNIIEQIISLIDRLPENLELVKDKVIECTRSTLNDNSYIASAINASIGGKDFTSFGSKNLMNILNTLFNGLMGGYSAALTAFNLCLLPFFVFYLSRDLKNFHLNMQNFFPELQNQTFIEIATEIVERIRSFFKGQITVCLILAGLYCLGFTLVGLPSAFGVGVLTGILNIFPYFGVAFGLLTSTVLVLSSNFSMFYLGKVYLVFVVIQLVEGNFITPKIVSDSVGVHPLVVMVAIIIGGQILGLVGLLIAIPTAAGIGVILNRALTPKIL